MSYPTEGCTSNGMIAQVKAAQCAVHNPTVAENIDNRIAFHSDEILRLKAVKAKLETGDIASIPINDLRNAMSY